MVRALPRNLQLKPEQTLSQSPRWHRIPQPTRASEVVRILFRQPQLERVG